MLGNGSELTNERKSTMTKAGMILLLMGLLIGFGVMTHNERVDGVEAKEQVGQKNFGYRPNIIHIFMDDVGVNDMGYTNAPYKTPSIDWLAKTGIVLDEHRVFPSCSPTRMAFLTGRLPYEFGVTHAGYMTQYELPPELVLPELLQTAGYRSFGFGKWHSGRASHWAQPTTRGFDSWTGFTPGFITQSNLINEVPWGFFTLAGFTKTHFDKFRKIEPSFGLYAWEEDGVITRRKVTKDTWADDMATDAALATLDNHCDVHTGRPCFIYLNFGSTHAPIEQPPTTRKEKRRCQYIQRKKRRQYCEMMQKIDSNLRRVVKKLYATGKWQDTMIVMSADNGGLPDIGAGNEPYLWDGYGSNLPYRGCKITVFEGGIKTMAIVSGGYTQSQFCKKTMGLAPSTCNKPGKLWRAMKSYRRHYGPIRKKGMVSVQDWFSTYAAIGGVQSKLIPHMVDGLDQSMMLFGDLASPRTEYSAIGGRKPTGEIIAGVVIQDNMKMVWRPADSKFVRKAAKMGWRKDATLDGYWNVEQEPTVRKPADGEGEPVMLFDLKADPTESHNLYHDSNYLGVRRTLQARMDSLQQIYTADPFHMQPAGIYASVEEGYKITSWEDDPRYNTYNGTLRQAVLHWVRNKKSKGGAAVVAGIEVEEGYKITSWEDDPRYNTYNGTLRQAVLHWVRNKKSKGGAAVVAGIEAEDAAVKGSGGAGQHAINEDDYYWP